MQSSVGSRARSFQGPPTKSTPQLHTNPTLRRVQQRHRTASAAGLSAEDAAGCSSCCPGSAPTQQCTCGIVIVDHGSRRKASNDMLVEFCQLYQQITQHAIVEPAHMEIAEPSIAQAIGRCVEAGAQRVVVAPYFLSKGRHIQDDIPALVAAAQEQFPSVTCSVAEPIGIEPLMVKIIQQRVGAVLLAKDCPAVATATSTADAQAAAVAASLMQ